MSANSKENRLPPPAFPPGSRKHVHKNSVHHDPDEALPGPGADGAFISPDDPLPPRRDAVQQAFISPDDPLPERRERMSLILPDDPLPGRGPSEETEDEGVVTGMGDDPHLAPHELVSAGDPHVAELVEAVGRLAEALRRKGEAGLRTSPGMARFDATLRSYCVGYLAGRRAGDEAGSDA